jgi:DNA-binding GntR family transcriptional regulator
VSPANGRTPRADAAELVFDHLRDGILQGRYAPGARLVETQIADVLDVSRTPVREALVRLASAGYVDMVRNRGAFVTQWSERDLEEIFGLRVLLESHGARLAAGRIGREELTELEELAGAMDESLRARGPGYANECTELNTTFHGTLVGAAGNQRLSTMVSNLTQLPLIHRTIELQAPDELARSFAQHRDMITAMKRRDGEWAESLMRAHILGGRDVMRRSSQMSDAGGG